jgi:hypothetical protein
MLAERASIFAPPAALRVPYAGESGTHYHIAIQFDQQGAYDFAASHYLAAAETAVPGSLRDFCLLRYRVLTIGNRTPLEPSRN